MRSHRGSVIERGEQRQQRELLGDGVLPRESVLRGRWVATEEGS